MRCQAIAFGGAHLDQLAAAGQQCRQLTGGGLRQRPRGWSNRCAEVGQQLRIQRVGLGQPTGRAREVAHLAWVGSDDRQPNAGQTGHRRQLIPTRRLEHDALGAEVLQALDELLESGLVVVDLPVLGGRMDGDVQNGFADVDPNTDGGVRCVGHGLLPPRAGVPGSARPCRFGLRGERPWQLFGLGNQVERGDHAPRQSRRSTWASIYLAHLRAPLPSRNAPQIYKLGPNGGFFFTGKTRCL